MTLKRLIIAELNQIPLDGVNLCGSEQWNQEPQPQKSFSDYFHTLS